jgi:hypothetical protein
VCYSPEKSLFSSTLFVVSPGVRLTPFAEELLGSGDTGFSWLIGFKKASNLIVFWKFGA